MDEEDHRKKAVELRERARAERNVSTRLEWVLLAMGFDRLADHARRNAQNSGDPDLVASQQRRQRLAQAQQQQQQQPSLLTKRRS